MLPFRFRSYIYIPSLLFHPDIHQLFTSKSVQVSLCHLWALARIYLTLILKTLSHTNSFYLNYFPLKMYNLGTYIIYTFIIINYFHVTLLWVQFSYTFLPFILFYNLSYTQSLPERYLISDNITFAYLTVTFLLP